MKITKIVIKIVVIVLLIGFLCVLFLETQRNALIENTYKNEKIQIEKDNESIVKINSAALSKDEIRKIENNIIYSLSSFYLKDCTQRNIKNIKKDLGDVYTLDLVSSKLNLIKNIKEKGAGDYNSYDVNKIISFSESPDTINVVLKCSYIADGDSIDNILNTVVLIKQDGAWKIYREIFNLK